MVRVVRIAVPPFWLKLAMALFRTVAPVLSCRPKLTVVAVKVPAPTVILKLPVPVEPALVPLFPLPMLTVAAAKFPAPKVKVPVPLPAPPVRADRPIVTVERLPVAVPPERSKTPVTLLLAFRSWVPILIAVAPVPARSAKETVALVKLGWNWTVPL